MDDKIGGATMPRMLNLRNILELVNDGLNDGSFAQQQFVRQGHELILHVFAQAGDEVESLFKEQLRQGSGNVAAIPKQLAAQSFHQLGNRSAIIDIAWRQATGQQVTAIIDGQVEFEAEEPTHAAFAAFGIGGKDAMLTDAPGITDFQRGRVNEAEASARAISALQVGEHRYHDARNEGDKALITDQIRKFAGQMYLDMFGVIRLKGAIVGLMKMDQNGHHLTRPALAACLLPVGSLSIAAQSAAKNHRHDKTIRVNSWRDPSDDE